MNYVLEERIGVGSFGTVYKARGRVDNEIVAIKVIDLDGTEDELEDVRCELELLSTANNCEQLVKFVGSHIVDGQLWIATEFMEGGSLGGIMEASGNTFAESIIAGVVKQLLLALHYMHSERRVHRDVKSKNILVSVNGFIKLADFGVTARLTDTTTKRKSLIGTPYWMAPEVIEQSRYDAKADIWSLGITAIELSRGVPPHAELHPMKVLFVVPNSPPPRLDHGQSHSPELQAFVANCVQMRGIDRPSAQQLLESDAFVLSADIPASAQQLAQLVSTVTRPEHRPLPSNKLKCLQEQQHHQIEKLQLNSTAPSPANAFSPVATPPRFTSPNLPRPTAPILPLMTTSLEVGSSAPTTPHNHHRKPNRSDETMDAKQKNNESHTSLSERRPTSCDHQTKKSPNSRVFRVLFAPAIATAARYAIAKGGDSRRSAALALDDLCKAMENVDRALPDGRLTLQLALGLSDTIDQHRSSLDSARARFSNHNNNNHDHPNSRPTSAAMTSQSQQQLSSQLSGTSSDTSPLNIPTPPSSSP